MSAAADSTARGGEEPVGGVAVLHWEELEAKVGSKYALVVAIAKRAEQLKEGAVPLIDCPSSNPVTIAMHEVAQDALIINPVTLVPEERQLADALVEHMSLSRSAPFGPDEGSEEAEAPLPAEDL